MAKDSGEERLIPPTPRRLQKLRDDGQVPRSRDFQTATSFIAVMIYLVMSWRGIAEKVRALFGVPDPSSHLGFGDEYARVVSGVFRISMELLLPVFIVAIFGGLLGSIIDSKGFPINTKALAPNFEKISPAKGLENLFSKRSLIELVKGLVTISLVIGANIILFRMFYNDLFWAPSCGGGCSTKVFIYLIGSSVAVGIIVVLILAFVDLPLARWHFGQDNRMSVSEFKREIREEFGDPQIRQERRRQVVQQAQVSEFLGLHRSQILLSFGDAAIALSYVPGKTNAPIISARTREHGAEFVRRAAEMHLPIIEDPSLVVKLLAGGGVGYAIPDSTYNEVARILIQSGIFQTGR